MKIHTIFATALTVALSVTSCSKQSGDVFTLTSPDGKLELSVQKDSAGIWEYTFAGNKEELIKGSR